MSRPILQKQNTWGFADHRVRKIYTAFTKPSSSGLVSLLGQTRRKFTKQKASPYGGCKMVPICGKMAVMPRIFNSLLKQLRDAMP